MKYNLKPDERATLELRWLYEKYGYKKYKISKFEEYSLYASNRDFIAGDKVLTFTDLDGKLLAMKPDVTLSVINNSKATRTQNEKLYYIENVYRENKENHCFKEISQMGLEFMGDVDTCSILEVVNLALKSLKLIDKDFLMAFSYMEYTMDLLDSLNVNEGQYLDLLNAIRRKNSAEIVFLAKEAGLDENMTKLLSELPFLYGEMGKTIRRAKEMAVNEKMVKDIEVLEGYCRAIKSLGYSKNIQLDLSMVNDIDYYNGLVFKGYIRDLPGCVLSGGQYNKAMNKFGKDAEAIGFAIYLDELLKGQAEPSKYDVDAVLLYDEKYNPVSVIKAVKELQKQGMSVRAEKNIPEGLRYKEKYIIKDGQPIKEEL